MIHERYPRTSLLLTLGKAGSRAWQVTDGGVAEARQPAFPVKAVDTTAAGDCVLGYYAAALAENLSYAAALRLAAAAAALSVRRPGAAPSIPIRSEVEAYLRGIK